MSATPWRIVAADTLAPQVLHAACTAAYADYLAGPFTLPPAQWPNFVARQGTDLGASRAALGPHGEVLAFAFVAPRPRARRWRLAGMGAVPAARGSGAAPALLDDFVRRAAAAGQQAVELEVFARNERALRLYRGRGFDVRHELHGFVREAAVAQPAAGPARGVERRDAENPALAGRGVEEPRAEMDDVALREAGRDDALAWLDATEDLMPDLPLQVCGASLRAAAAPWRAWRHGTAQLVHAASPAGDLVVSSFVDRDPAQHDAQRLLQAWLAPHAGARVQVPPLQRDDTGGAALRRADFAPQALHQLLMVRALP